MSLFNKRTVESLFQFGQVDERITQGRQAGMSPFDTRTVSPVEGLFQFAQADEPKTEESKAAHVPNHPPHTAIGDIRALFADKIVQCRLCLEVGKHGTAGCPYRVRVPKNAHVDSAYEIICINCGSLFLEGCCGLDEGRAILKGCSLCGGGGHWPKTCPRNDGTYTSTIFPPSCLVQACKTEESNLGAVASSSFTYSPDNHRSGALGSKIEERKVEKPKAAPTHPPPSGFSVGDIRALFADKIVECRLCLEVGKHGTAGCPYQVRVPKNACVDSAYEIVCRNCGSLFLEGCCGLDEGCAILKGCSRCGGGGHWPKTCPLNDGTFTSAIFHPAGLQGSKTEEPKDAPARTYPLASGFSTSDFHG